MKKERASRDNIQREGWKKHSTGCTLFFSRPILMHNLQYLERKGEWRWQTVQSTMNYGPIKLSRKSRVLHFWRKILQFWQECDSAIEKKAVYTEVKLQYWIQRRKPKLFSINISHLIANQVLCVIAKYEIRFLVMLIILLLTTLWFLQRLVLPEMCTFD